MEVPSSTSTNSSIPSAILRRSNSFVWNRKEKSFPIEKILKNPDYCTDFCDFLLRSDKTNSVSLVYLVQKIENLKKIENIDKLGSGLCDLNNSLPDLQLPKNLQKKIYSNWNDKFKVQHCVLKFLNDKYLKPFEKDSKNFKSSSSKFKKPSKLAHSHSLEALFPVKERSFFPTKT